MVPVAGFLVEGYRTSRSGTVARYVPILQQHASGDVPELELLEWRAGALRLVLGCVQTRLEVVFDAAFSYRVVDEGDDLVALGAIASPGRIFYRVEDSDYLAWFIGRGHGVRDGQGLQHYAILTINEIVDVLSLGDPAVAALGSQ